MDRYAGAFSGPGGASRFVEVLSIDIIKAAGSLRQGVGSCGGERAAPSLAAAAVELVELEERGADGKLERVTEEGEKTARRKAPPALSRLDPFDGRRMAAERYAVAVERLGALSGSNYSEAAGSGGVGGGVNDGGAAVRAQRAAVLRMVRGIANGWEWSSEHRSFVTGEDLVILAPTRGKGDRLSITAMGLLDAAVIEGRNMREILEAHGWSPQSRLRKALSERLMDILDLVADGMGLSARLA